MSYAGTTSRSPIINENGVEITAGQITKCPRSHSIKGYKGLKKQKDGSLKCRDLVYEPETVYVHDAKPDICNTGFHFCEKLEDVFEHYNVTDKNHVFYQVEAWGNISHDKNGSKSSAQFITLTKPVPAKTIFIARLQPTLKLVDKIVAANPNAIICGSLALILRGWIPYRAIGDIDILLPFYQDFGENSRPANCFGKSGIDTLQMLINDGTNKIHFDLFIDPTETWSWVTFGTKKYKVAHVKKLIEAKMRYYMAGAHKHGADLKNIFDQVEKHHLNDKNAFLRNGGLHTGIIDPNQPKPKFKADKEQYLKGRNAAYDYEHEGELGFCDDDLNTAEIGESVDLDDDDFKDL